MTTPDIQHCAEMILHGSHSFHAASRLLPRKVREPALALYAFCRIADDAVDLHSAKADAVLRLHERLDLAYAGTPLNAPPDRAFASLIDEFGMPRALPEALLEGLAWDAMGRRYATLSDLRAYSARVAAAVGAMMCVLMGVRDRMALARACDLGVAMQLTNIARDVGEDAREGRLYLPLDWLEDAGVDRDRFLAAPTHDSRIGALIRHLLREAERLYGRSEAGVALLPANCRPGIFAARLIYAGIGGRIRRNGYDSINHRARTTKSQKLGWLAISAARSGATTVMPRSPIIYAAPLPETAFLVEAAAEARDDESVWTESFIGALARLKAQDISRREALIAAAARAS